MTELDRSARWDELAGNTCEYRDLNDDLPQDYYSFIKEEMQELNEAIYKEDRIEVLDALGDLLKVVQGMAHVLGYDAEELLRIVNDSNYSKFANTIEEAEVSCDAYLHKIRYEGVYYEQVGDYYIVRGYERGTERKGKGKVLKAYAYQDPKITQYHNERFADDGSIKQLEKIEPDELTQDLNRIQQEDKDEKLRQLLGLDKA